MKPARPLLFVIVAFVLLAAVPAVCAAEAQPVPAPTAAERIRDLLYRFEHELHALQAEIQELQARLDRIAERATS